MKSTPLVNLDEVEINCELADVLQLDIFGVRIIGLAGIHRMIHNLGNSQVLTDIRQCINRLVKRTPFVWCCFYNIRALRLVLLLIVKPPAY